MNSVSLGGALFLGNAMRGRRAAAGVALAVAPVDLVVAGLAGAAVVSARLVVFVVDLAGVDLAGGLAVLRLLDDLVRRSLRGWSLSCDSSDS